MPLCLNPPNGVEYRTDELEFTLSVPLCTARTMRSARAPSRVQIDPDRPYGVALASRAASASSSNGRTVTTGPKISSLATRLCSDAPVTTVGGYQKPGPSGTSPWNAIVAFALERRHLRTVGGRDQRTHEHVGIVRPADADARRDVGDELDEAVVHRAFDEDPAAGAAVLSGVVEHRARHACRGRLEVGVGEHDVGALAAELERDPLQRVGRAPHDVLADRRRPGEADLGDVRMVDQPLPGRRPVADHDVEDAFGDAGLERQLGEADARQRRQLARLEHHRVAARQRRAELPRRRSASGSSTA